MAKARCVRLTVLSLFCLATFIVFPQEVSASEQHDVRIVVDISGSMKKTDPKLLRRPAVNLVAQMLPEGAQSGVWTFGRFVNMLVPLSRVDEAWRERVQADSQKINSAGLYTNIPDALGKATAGWQVPDPNTKRSMIFLTDGKVDISKDPVINAKAREDVISRLIPKLRQTGANVHTIALSEDVDAELLQALSFQTGGQFLVANSEDDLVRVFVSAFDASVPQQQVPLSQDNLFDIDASVNEFTVLVYKRPGASAVELVSPDGQTFSLSSHPSNVRWFADDTMEMATITAPQAGQWQLVADVDPANRVTVLSDLTLKISDMPNHIMAGQSIPIDIYFTDTNGIVTQKSFFSLLDVKFSQHYIDGNKVWEGQLTSYSSNQVKIPSDGHFHANLSKSLLPGEHEITVLAEGRTFQRQVVRKVSVIPDVIKASLRAPADAKDVFTLNVSPVWAYVDTQLSVEGKVQAPNKSVRALNLVLQDQGAKPTGWQAQFDAFGGPGVYRVILLAEGETLVGTSVRSEVGPLEASTPDAQALDAAFSYQKPQSNSANDSLFDLQESEQPPVQEQAPEEEMLQAGDPGQGFQSRDYPASGTQEPDPLDEDPWQDLPDEEPVIDEQEELPIEEELEELEQEQEQEQEETEPGLSSGLKWTLISLFILFNLTVMIIGFVFYRRTVKKKSKEFEEEDSRLQALTAADFQDSDEKTPEADDREDLPDDMPEPPNLDDDDEEPAFDPSRIA